MRYQFEPRAHHTLDPQAATKWARLGGAKYVRGAFPLMPGGNVGSFRDPGRWIGSNQPRTVTFSVANDEAAKAIEIAYGDHNAFVRNKDTGRLV